MGCNTSIAFSVATITDNEVIIYQTRISLLFLLFSAMVVIMIILTLLYAKEQFKVMDGGV
jgi:hypothetical protein